MTMQHLPHDMITSSQASNSINHDGAVERQTPTTAANTTNATTVDAEVITPAPNQASTTLKALEVSTASETTVNAAASETAETSAVLTEHRQQILLPPSLNLAFFPKWMHSNRMGFLAAGFAIAAWAPIIPFIKERFMLDEHGLGLLLLCVGCGSLFSSPLSGILTSRFGCKIPIFGATITWALCIALISVVNNIYLMAVILFIFGMAAVILEVVSNINGAMIERITGKTIMSGLHALYSLGGLLGSFGVTFILGANAGVVAAAAAAAIFMLSGVLIGGRSLFNHEQLSHDQERNEDADADANADANTADAESARNRSNSARTSARDCVDESAPVTQATPAADAASDIAIATSSEDKVAFVEQKQQVKKAVEHAHKSVHHSILQKRYVLHPVILMISFMLFVLYLTEGAMLDWSGVYLYEERGVSLEMAGYGYAAFAIMMTLCRFFGDKVVLRMGRRRVIVLGTMLICLGFVLSALIDHAIGNILCFMLIGVGSSNVIPQLVSYVARVSDVPMHISVTLVNSFGFTGVLMGPAIIGFVAQHVTLPNAFILLGIFVLSVTFLSFKYLRATPVNSK